MRFLASRVTRAADSRPVAVELDWPDSFDDFRVGEKDGPAILPATLDGQGRSDKNVVAVHALFLDYDKGGLDAAEVLARWEGYERVLHSTHTPGRWRVILPYARPHTPAEHARVYAWAIEREGEHIDPSCKNPSRIFYLPTVRPGLDDEPTFGYASGALLDVGGCGTVDLVPRTGPASGAPSSYPPAWQATPASPPLAKEESRGVEDPYAGIDTVQQREDLPLIEERCAFMRHAHEDAATLPEPEWYAWLSVVARCRGGDELAHTIGSAHPGYSRPETEEKIARAKAVGPATCTYVRSISSACKGCPLQVTSPVLLGRRERATDASPEPVEVDVREYEVVVEARRVEENRALVAVEQAKKRLSLLRRANSTASEDDVAEAVTALSSAKDAVRGAERARKAAEKALAQVRQRLSVEGLPAGADPAVWQRLRIARSGDGAGRPVATLANVLTILDTDPRWASRLTFDAFALDVLLDGEPFPEEMATELTAKLSYDYHLDTTTPLVMECVRAVARKRQVHPVRDWLDGLRWDGVARVRDMLMVGFGADPRDDEDLVRLIGEKFLLALLARAYVPGAKVDTMPILIGKQGAFKSTALEELVGTKWFARSKLDLLSKDSFMNLRGKWLYEIAELGGLKRVEQHVSKAWLDNSVDRYRAPYAKRADDHPRTTVMGGTDNVDEVLMDPTGYRRYWPVRVRVGNLEWIRANREQLFAEAVVLRQAGRTWWFDEASEETARLRRWCQPFQSTHPWTETIVAWLEDPVNRRDSFSIVDVLTHALMKSVADIRRQDSTDVGGILLQLGCEKMGRAVQQGMYTTKYRRPADMVERLAQRNVHHLQKKSA